MLKLVRPRAKHTKTHHTKKNLKGSSSAQQETWVLVTPSTPQRPPEPVPPSPSLDQEPPELVQPTPLPEHKSPEFVQPTPFPEQKPPNPVQLPLELVLIISESLSLRDRARLLQTCRSFRSVLEGGQYRHLRLATSWRLGGEDPLHRTLSERPDLIPYIISYRGPLVPRVPAKRFTVNAGKTLGDLPESDPFRRAVFIFTQAVNLRVLEFTDDCTRWRFLLGWKLLNPAITKLTLTQLSLPPTLNSEDIISLLHSQPALERLTLEAALEGFNDLQETDIPNLRSLTATLQDAATIVPGRPVEEFFRVWQPEEPGFDEGLVRKLSLSSVPITKLEASLGGRRARSASIRSTIQVISRHLPEIQDLTLFVSGLVSAQTVSHFIVCYMTQSWALSCVSV